MAPVVRRRDVFGCCGSMGLLLVLTAKSSDAFTTFAYSRGGRARAKAPRMAPVRSLHMAGGPRGRSTQGIAIQGIDGNQAILTASAKMPIESIQRVAEYAQDDLVDGASLGAEDGLDEFDLSGFTTSSGGESSGNQAYQMETGSRKLALDKRRETLSRKNTLILNGILVATVGAAAWVTATSFLGRQRSLVEAYGDEMTYHVGNEKEMMLCHKEYKRKLGPGMYREAMFKEVLLAIGQKRPSTLETVQAIRYVIKLFGVTTSKALKHIVAVSKSTEKSQSNLRVKLYFIGTVMSKGDEKLSAILEPLRKRIESSFYANGEEMLKIRVKEMAEVALKSAIEALPDDKMLESGWEELGISAERASEIASELSEGNALTNESFYKTGGAPTNDEKSDPEAAAMLKQLEAEIEVKKTEPQDEKEPDAEGTAKSYECSSCGYKMFVAVGREFKFFGDDFKCPECGAGKSKFIEGDSS